MQFKRLFSPITVNGMNLKNRIIMPAIHCGYTPGGHITEQFSTFYYARAEGGAGLIIIGGMRFDELGGPDNMPSLASDEFIEEYKAFTDGMHTYGVKVCAQLYHGGRYVRPDWIDGKQPISSSATFSAMGGTTSREMTSEDIKKVQQRWTEGAVRAQKAGFDAVEILSCSGYLINQFLSGLTNHRTDHYGGSFENRSRFGSEVVESIRNAVGPNYPILMRLSGNDFVPGGGGLSESIDFAKVAEKAGVNLFNITGGWHETTVPQLSGDMPEGAFTYLGQGIKDAVDVPISMSNRISDPFLAEENLALEKSDMISVARGMITDPEWPNKVREGRIDEIRRCVGCNQGCLANSFFGKPLACILNGLAGREYLFKDLKPTSSSKSILVVGGGPAGAEFAIRAAQRNHKVTLWEKKEITGGQLPLVATPSNKKDFNSFIHYQSTMLQKSGVNVVTSKNVNAQEIIDGNFDVVVISTGVLPRPFSLDNDKGLIPVYRSEDVLAGNVIPGKNIIIVGGGTVGCEVAEYLAARGSITPEQLHFLTIHKAETPETIESLLNKSARNVAIVEIQSRIGSGFDPGTAWPVMKELGRLKVAMHASSKIIQTGESFVTIEKIDKNGNTNTFDIPCDSIILAVGSIPNDGLFKELEGKVANIHSLGDCKQIGKIMSAIYGAVDLVFSI